MKCVCGYEQMFIINEKTGNKEKTEGFIKVDLYVQTMPGFDFKLVFACPKCGTLKLDI